MTLNTRSSNSYRGVIRVIGVNILYNACENLFRYIVYRVWENNPKKPLTPRHSGTPDSDACTSQHIMLIFALMVVLFCLSLRYIMEVMA